MRWIALGLTALAFILGVVALNIDWAEADDDGAWRMMSAKVEFGLSGDQQGFFPWTNDGFDDDEGIGLLRAGGPLWITALVLLGAALVAPSYKVYGFPWMDWAVTGAVALAALFAVLALVLFPIGVAASHQGSVDAGQADGTVSWLAGLYLGIAATLAFLGAAATQIMSMRR